MEKSRLKILLIEDNPDDIKLFKYGLKEKSIKSKLFLAKDGDEAEKFISRQNEHQNAPIPNLIILDLGIPKKDGFAILKIIKSHSHLKAVPVIILSNSEKAQDVIKSYDSYANCFIRKPSDLDQFLEVMKRIKDFWVRIALLPTLKAS